MTSPKKRWEKSEVIFNGGPGPATHSVAIGLWDSEPAMVMRWNGGEKRPKGNPVSTGHPTWFVIPPAYHRAILGSLKLADAVLIAAVHSYQSTAIDDRRLCADEGF